MTQIATNTRQFRIVTRLYPGLERSQPESCGIRTLVLNTGGKIQATEDCLWGGGQFFFELATSLVWCHRISGIQENSE